MQATEILHPQGCGSCVKPTGEKRQKRVITLWDSHGQTLQLTIVRLMQSTEAPPCVGLVTNEQNDDAQASMKQNFHFEESCSHAVETPP